MGGIGVIAAGFGAGELYQRVCGDRKALEAETSEPIWHFELSAARRFALWLAGACLNVRGRHRRSPGFRLLGLRRVDAHTGGPVSARSALAGEVIDAAWRAVTRPLFRFPAKRERERFDALRPRMKEIEHAYANDPEGRRRALMDFYKTNHMNPLTPCGWQFAGRHALDFTAISLAVAGPKHSRPPDWHSRRHRPLTITRDVC